MRLLIISPGFPAYRGPFVPGIVPTIQALAKTHELEVHTIRSTLPEIGRTVYRGVTIEAYGNKNFGAQMARLLGHAAARRRENRYELVWSLWPNRTGSAAIAAARLLGCPIMVSLLGGEVARFDDLNYGALRSPRSRQAVRASLGAARVVTVGSEYMRDELLSFSARTASKCVLTPLGAPLSRIVPRTIEPWTPGRPLRLLAVSDTSRIKRLDVALDALARLVESGIEASLDVFGSDRRGVKQAFERRAKGLDVHFRGFVPFEWLCNRFAEYDVFVHPSLHESQGMALIEAAMARLPIACMDVGVARELSRLGAAVQICEHEDAYSLAEAVRKAAPRTPADPERIRLRFNLERCVERFEDALQRAAGS